MEYLKNVDVVVAKSDGKGAAYFDTPPPIANHSVPGAVEAAYVWGVDQLPTLPFEIGGGLQNVSFPEAGGVRFGLVCFPPKSAGKMNMRAESGATNLDVGEGAGMHRSDTIDFEVIVSGKIDIVLEGGARRTLHPGSCLVMGGVMHAWENIYDEPCIYSVVVLGARAKTSE